MPLVKRRRNNLQRDSKMYALVLSSCMFFTPRAGSLDEVWMLLHQLLAPLHQEKHIYAHNEGIVV
jgi:hypothetical protein